MKYEYPKCRKSDLVEEWFGAKLEVPYTWLRDTYSNEVLDFTRRENEFTDDWFKSEAEGEVDAMIAKLKSEHREELPMGISPWRNGFLATEVREGNYAIVSLDGDFNKVETLFVRNDLPERTPFSAEACPKDENILAIMSQVDNAPRPDYVIYDWDKKEVLDILPMTFGGTWSKKKKIFYIATTKVIEEKSLTAILAYDAVKGESKEVFVFEGNAIFGGAQVSDDGESVLFSFCPDYSTNYFFVYDEETGRIDQINEKALQLHYVDSFDGKHFFISFEDAYRGAIISIKNGETIGAAETVYVEESAYIDSGFLIDGELFIQCSKDAASYIMNLNTKEMIAMPASVASLAYSGKTKDKQLFAFDAFLSDPQVLEFDGKEFKRIMGNETAHDDLMVELLYAESKEDKKPIPYYLVRRKDAERNGNNKALIYGYGGYNVPMPPWSKERVTQTHIARWVEEGGIYVHCLLRGGSEYGSTWHEEGMGMTKKNCYHDFIGIAEKVMADGWTKPEKTAISGASNGGLLMAALVTMRPDLWGCVVASVPHTDMIHFADDDRGAMYVTEYGNPRESKEMFEYLLSYSPVHNVRAVDYPPTYIQTGECDNNVPPYHGKSFAATMQELNTSDNPVLLRVLEKGAHDRGQGDVYWQTIAEMRVFMDKALG